jgi:hypothetical protein
MTIPKEVQDALKNDYRLIPMSEITDEARVIAVKWMECGDRDFIREKHKLASDIMNYARRYNTRLIELLKQVVTREQSEVHPHFQEEVWKEFAKKNNIV